ncbi:MAG: peptidoglycan-binding protein [Eubacteriales bacterium]
MHEQFYDILDPANAVCLVQEFLYELHCESERIPVLYPDGIYGEETREAVRCFQLLEHLPQTGEVDYHTWQRLYQRYAECKERRLMSAQPTVPKSAFPLTLGSRGYPVIILRAALNELRTYYPDLPLQPISGIYQYTTADAVRQLQKAYLMEASGVVDMETWNRIHRDLHTRFKMAEARARTAPPVP